MIIENEELLAVYSLMDEKFKVMFSIINEYKHDADEFGMLRMRLGYLEDAIDELKNIKSVSILKEMIEKIERDAF